MRQFRSLNPTRPHAPVKKEARKVMKRIVAITLFLIFLFNIPKTPTHVYNKIHFLNSATIGFSIDSVARVDSAAQLGVNTVMRYGTAFTPSDAVGAEMLAKGMHEIDAGFASELFYYECHRTHTVVPPPVGVQNTYCPTDEMPSINSETALLAAIDAKLQADANNPLIVGYWVLDDWAPWDSGSAKIILQHIHNHIQLYTPFYPAICGFGFTVTIPTVTMWQPVPAKNYSNGGCDMVGLYAYVDTHAGPTNGSQFDFSMQSELPSAFRVLQQQGWNIKNTPLIGIDQAFAGPYAGTRYEPGLTTAQMVTQAQAFCKAGAASVGWYGWDDSGFGSQTATPMTSTQIQQGISQGIAACQSVWHKKS